MRAAALLVVLALTILLYLVCDLALKLCVAAGLLYLLCKYLKDQDPPEPEQEEVEAMPCPYNLRTRPTKPAIDPGIYLRY